MRLRWEKENVTEIFIVPWRYKLFFYLNTEMFSATQPSEPFDKLKFLIIKIIKT